MVSLYSRIHRPVNKFCRAAPSPPPRPRRARHACRAPRPPRGTGYWSRGTLYRNEIIRPIPSKDLLEGIETLTELWYNNIMWPRKMPGRTSNLYIYTAVHSCSRPSRDPKKIKKSLSGGVTSENGGVGVGRIGSARGVTLSLFWRHMMVIVTKYGRLRPARLASVGIFLLPLMRQSR